jgi:hypothetical protein
MFSINFFTHAYSKFKLATQASFCKQLFTANPVVSFPRLAQNLLLRLPEKMAKAHAMWHISQSEFRLVLGFGDHAAKARVIFKRIVL